MAKNLIVLLVLLAGCSAKPPPEIQWRAFDSDRAYGHVQKLVSLGPRPSGSPALTRAAVYITTQLQDAGLDTEEQSFVAPTPNGPVQFRNIVGKTRAGRGGPGQVIVIGSHYDTKWLTNITFVGANDGGSSTGVALEMARVASAQPNLWFVFLDGEEAVQDYGPEDGLTGSKFFVESLKGDNQVSWIKAAIILDMVGDAHLKIDMPANSTGPLIERVFAAAHDTGYRDYFGYGKTEMLDDHVPFLRAGIPAVDLIDFEFGSAPGLNDYWHTDKDTLDKISPRSLGITGQTALRLVSLLMTGEGVAMRELKTWYEDDRFWELSAPIMFGEQCWQSAAPQITQLISLTGMTPPADVLDLCCGMGRHSLELARRGFQVTGVDRTAAYLDRARKQAEKENLPIDFIQDDMRHFARPHAYDLVINLFTSFGYFENPAEDKRVLVNMAQSLKKGGRLVMEMLGKEILARIFRERDWREQDGVIWFEERKVSKDWSWIDNRWISLRGDKRHEFRISHRLYSAAELTALLKECGFQKVDTFGNLAGGPYDHTAERLVVVAHH